MFAGTLRMNLDPLEIYSDDQLWNVLKQVNMKVYVENIEGKLSHECLDGGENLSIGQRQLICLARALLKNSKVVVLDEATAAIDQNTEESIYSVIKFSFVNSTVITIAHRLDTIMDCDRYRLRFILLLKG